MARLASRARETTSGRGGTVSALEHSGCSARPLRPATFRDNDLGRPLGTLARRSQRGEIVFRSRWPVLVVLTLVAFAGARLAGCAASKGFLVDLATEIVSPSSPEVLVAEFEQEHAEALAAPGPESSPLLRAMNASGVIESLGHVATVCWTAGIWDELSIVLDPPVDQPGGPGTPIQVVVDATASIRQDLETVLFFLGWTTIPDPTPASRIALGELVYLGAFRLPGAGFQYTQLENGIPIAAVAGRDELFVKSKQGIVRIDIPTPVASINWRDVPLATILEDNPLGGAQMRALTGMAGLPHRIGAIGFSHAATDGKVYLLTGSFEFYNVAGRDHLGICAVADDYFDDLGSATAIGGWRIGPANLSMPGPRGGILKDVFHANKTHGGYLATISPDWAARNLPAGYDVAGGKHRPAGAFGGGQGPCFSAFRFDPGAPHGGDLGAIPLMLYPVGSQTWPGYRNADQYEVTWIYDGNRSSVIVAACNGLGPNYYGNGPSCPCCDGNKGWHADPYEPRIFAMDPDDLAAVVAGDLEPWDPKPVEEEVPSWFWHQAANGTDPRCLAMMNGLAFHPDRKELFVVEGWAWPQAGNNNRTGAIVHVLGIRPDVISF